MQPERRAWMPKCGEACRERVYQVCLKLAEILKQRWRPEMAFEDASVQHDWLEVLKRQRL